MESKPFNKHIKALLSKSKYMLVRGERWAEMTGQFEHRVRHGGRQTGRKSMSHILHEHIYPSITKQCRTDSPLCLYRHSRQSCGAGHTWRHCTSLCVCLLSYTRSLVLKKKGKIQIGNREALQIWVEQNVLWWLQLKGMASIRINRWHVLSLSPTPCRHSLPLGSFCFCLFSVWLEDKKLIKRRRKREQRIGLRS